MPASSPELDRWNQKYRASPGSWLEHDPFLPRAFSEYIHPLFPAGGNVLDLAGGAGRHAIWLARQGWEVTLIDIAEEGLALARKNAEGVVSQIHFVLDDLSHFRAAQAQFDLVIAFFFLERSIFPANCESHPPRRSPRLQNSDPRAAVITRRTQGSRTPPRGRRTPAIGRDRKIAGAALSRADHSESNRRAGRKKNPAHGLR